MAQTYSIQAFRGFVRFFLYFNMVFWRRGPVSLATPGPAWFSSVQLLSPPIFLFKLGDEYSRVWMVSWFLLGAVALTAERIALSAIVGHLTARWSFRPRGPPGPHRHRRGW